MWACQYGHIDCVRALLEAGAPVAQAKQDGTSALMMACGYGNVACARALIGAALYARATRGWRTGGAG
jgi:ankyrin repeat protein